MRKLLLVLLFSWFVGTIIAQTTVNVNADITSNTTWTADKIYILTGPQFVYVTNNVTLTIEPGTLIKGDQTGLVVTRGSKIIADGTVAKPIVFTSSKPAGQRGAGDWGALAILGGAPVNCPGGECLLEGGVDPLLGKYGGTDAADNSGSLKYVRIEFGGIAFQPNNETNSLTLAGVGSGTTIQNVQTSFGGDDGIEWFGGTVDGKYLIVYKTLDDMFDTDFGYSGNNQYVLGVSEPAIADVSGSNAFESDNDAQGTLNTPITNSTFSNVTILGPLSDAPATINNNYRRGMHIRRSSRQDVLNSVIIGFPTGARIESANSEAAFLTDGTLNVRTNVFAGNTKYVDSTSTNFSAVRDSVVKRNTLLSIIDLKLVSLGNTDPKPWPDSGSPLLTGGIYTGLPAFFEKPAYRGAFGTSNWTACWAEFDPINADYSTGNFDYTAGIGNITATVNGAKVDFTAPVGTGFTYAWDFGVVTTGTDVSIAPNPSYTYSNSGTYNVKCTITTNRGCTRTLTTTVTILIAANEVIVSQDILTNTTWTNNSIYVLSGPAFVYVRNNATLTIQPGTIVKGNGTGLIITRGSKIIADGTVTQPIVFTSSKPAGQRAAGDWGSLSLLGLAPVNCPGGECLLEGGLDPLFGKYGGTDGADNSGILRYVRIEFGGIAFQPNNETNSLTMGGIGSGTIIEHVQASFGGDDGFEWFGGTVNGKYLITYKTLDDMFDTDFGYVGNNQFVLGVSEPTIADVSGSNGFESDNDAQGTTNNPITNSTFSNVTILGPRVDPMATINTNYRRGMHIRRSSRQDVVNSLIIGFPTAVRIESANSETAFLTNGTLNVENNVFAGNTKAVDSTSINFIAVKALVESNNEFVALAGLGIQSLSISQPNPLLNANSILSTGADFTDLPASFEKVNYQGAFDKNNWTNCWSEWDPNNADYVSAPLQLFQDPGEFTATLGANNVLQAFAPAGAGLTYRWDFGLAGTTADTSVVANPSFKYSNIGIYTITLVLTNARGCSLTKSKTVDVTVSTNTITELAGLKLFPNPVANELQVQLNSTESFEATIRITDANGKVLSSAVRNIQSGSQQLPLDVSNMPTGNYFLQITTDKGAAVARFAVQR